MWTTNSMFYVKQNTISTTISALQEVAFPNCIFATNSPGNWNVDLIRLQVIIEVAPDGEWQLALEQ